MSNSQGVIVPLPPQAKAPGYRDSFTTRAGMRVHELAPDWLGIAPREGAGNTYEYFRLERICDATKPPSDDTWASLVASAPIHAEDEHWPEPEEGKKDWHERLRAWGEKMYDPARPETHFASASAVLTTLPLEEAPAFLTERARE
jgi:hypothetical protein